jgi:hypothetical protein
LLWVSAAYAQPAPDTTTTQPSQSAGDASEPSAQQAQSPTAGVGTTQTAGQSTDPNQQIICHTMMNAGSRLSRHATRVCKTRQQWELEADQNQRDMRLHEGNSVPRPPN